MGIFAESAGAPQRFALISSLLVGFTSKVPARPKWEFLVRNRQFALPIF
jgi:hypothetical protein